MDWLGDWLKQVILIILLAAFVDLLLPNQAMQRYVKAVVSLFLLLTLLTPVFALLERGWDADRLIAEAEQLQTGYGQGQTLLAGLGGGPSRASKGGIESLESILAESEKLKAQNGADAQRLAEAKLAEEMKEGLRKATGREVGELFVTIDVNKKGEPVIGSVRATLLHRVQEPYSSEERKSGMDNGIGQIAPVKEVQSVTVTIGSSIKSLPAAAVASEEEQDQTVLAEAVRYFGTQWSVPPDRLVIQATNKQ